jgi:gamma-glutamylcyclotransferase (GGCT)/AIG2-like uncharacterized protein YtfP
MRQQALSPPAVNHACPVWVFVYGTLRPGTPEHAALCGDVVACAAAWVWGRLRQLPEGYPALELPDGAVLHWGTRDYYADAQRQAEVEPGNAALDVTTAGRWQRVEGVALCFPDARAALARLDEYEECNPGAPGLYDRVLTLAGVEGSAAAVWLYVSGRGEGRQ